LTVSVVICTRNRPAYLNKCLQAVAALAPPPDEVLVVDNSTGDEETESVAREFHAHYIVENNLGLSRARNRGMAESQCDIIAYLDDDATPEPHWLEYILAPFADPQVAAVTGRTVSPGTDIKGLQDEPVRSLSNQDPQWFEIASYGGLGLGNNMALRKSACAGNAVFDTNLGRGTLIGIGEEHHAFVSLVERGHRAVHIPDALVAHPDLEMGIEEQATSSVAYWLHLFSEFREHRMDLLRFLWRRLRRKPLTWPRQPQAAGHVIRSGWRIYLRAGINGGRIFLRARKTK
jgi:glycosyltransferase involved in cell wall biosynthesis